MQNCLQRLIDGDEDGRHQYFTDQNTYFPGGHLELCRDFFAAEVGLYIKELSQSHIFHLSCKLPSA